MVIIRLTITANSTLLFQVFTGELEICLKIKEQQVHHVFHLITYGGSVGQAELLRMLQAVVKVCEILLHAYYKLFNFILIGGKVKPSIKT